MTHSGATPTSVIAKRVNDLRKARGWTAQELADEMAAVGVPWTRLVVTKLENGRRDSVSVEEWLALAYVLAVPPPLLFLDLQTGNDVQIVPTVAVHPWLGWEWVTGEHGPVTAERYVTRVSEFAQSKQEIYSYLRERVAADAVHRASTDVRQAESDGDEGKLSSATAARLEALRALAKELDDMVARGMTPPGKPRRWVEIMREHDMLKYPDLIRIFEPREADADAR